MVLIVGFLAGDVAERLSIPRLLGMLVAGVLLGPHALGWISGDLSNLSDDIRMLALTVILFKAGLGLDLASHRQVFSVGQREDLYERGLSGQSYGLQRSMTVTGISSAMLNMILLLMMDTQWMALLS